MISNWNSSRMTTAGMGSVYGKEFASSNQIPSKDNGTFSNRGFNTISFRGIVGTAFQKCTALLASMFIPPETQTNTLDKNKKSFTAPDICVDININTPIFEAVCGKAKLTMPKTEANCDETKSFESTTFANNRKVDLNLSSSRKILESNPYDMVKPEGIPHIVAKNDSPKSMNIKNGNLIKKVPNWTPPHMRTKSKIGNKNRKEKDRHNLQINIMEDMWQIAADHELDSDKETCKSSPSFVDCSFSFSPSSWKGSAIDLSETSFPCISSSIPKESSYSDCSRRLSKCDSEESFIMLFDMTTPLARLDVCSTNSVIPTMFANRTRCRQISECSDDSIVFCYDDETDASCLPDVDYDDEEDSEEEETDAESCDEDSEGSQSHQPDSGFEERKVQFNLNPVVHVMRTWDFAYRQARKGEWEMAARDRERFKKRIQETETVLSTVFDEKLRNKVYEERFSCQCT